MTSTGYSDTGYDKTFVSCQQLKANSPILSVVITKPSKPSPDPSNESMAKLIFLVHMFSVGYFLCLRVFL
jgi:hypothetical protein